MSTEIQNPQEICQPECPELKDQKENQSGTSSDNKIMFLSQNEIKDVYNDEETKISFIDFAEEEFDLQKGEPTIIGDDGAVVITNVPLNHKGNTNRHEKLDSMHLLRREVAIAAGEKYYKENYEDKSCQQLQKKSFTQYLENIKNWMMSKIHSLRKK